jgi:hypothetical protein
VLDSIKKFTANLTSLDDQPISKAALAVIVFLDLFILVSIFDGLADHTNQLTKPADHIPQYCRDIVLDSEWNATIRLRNVARITSAYHDSYYVPDERETRKEHHVLCEPFGRVLRIIKEDEGLSRNLRATLKLQQESGELRSELARVKGAYDTSLLEVVAKQPHPRTDVSAIKTEIAHKTDSLNESVRKLALLESTLAKEMRLRELFTLVDSVSEADRTRLRDDLRAANFWYPVQRLGMEMLFLVPLFAGFYLWNAKSIARRRPLQTLVSSHLLVISLIPVLFKIIELVYDVIPKKLLKHVIELLESLKLVALWHYLLMGIAIVASLALIYLFQKKLFSREKLIEKRISKGLCQNCHQRLPWGSRVCPFCGFGQYRLCSQCSQPTHVYGRFCRECGYSGT